MAQFLVGDVPDELDAVGVGHRLQCLGLRAAASDEDDAVGLDVLLGLDETVDALVLGVAAHEEDDLLAVVLALDAGDEFLVALAEAEVGGDDAVLYDPDLVAVLVDGAGGVDVVGTGGEYEVVLPEDAALEVLDTLVEHPLAEDVGVPEKHELAVLGYQADGDGVEEGIGAVEHDDVGLVLLDDLLQVTVVGEGDVLARHFQRGGDAVDLGAVDGVHTGDAVVAEADDDIVKVRQPLGHVLGHGLDASFGWIIVFCYVE